MADAEADADGAAAAMGFEIVACDVPGVGRPPSEVMGVIECCACGSGGTRGAEEDAAVGVWGMVGWLLEVAEEGEELEDESISESPS